MKILCKATFDESWLVIVGIKILRGADRMLNLTDRFEAVIDVFDQMAVGYT